MSAEVLGALEELRTFMFQNMYLTPAVRNEFVKAQRTLTALFEYVTTQPEEFLNSAKRRAGRAARDRLHRRHDRPLRDQSLRTSLRSESLRLTDDPTPRAVIFDMDGLLVDSEPLYRVTWQTAAAELGLSDRRRLLPSIRRPRQR